MQDDFLNKAGKQALKIARKAGNKTTELVELGKLKSKLSDVNQAKKLAISDIGEYCYNQYKEGKIDDITIIEFCEKINAANEAIAQIESEIEATKAEYAEKNEDDGPNLND